MRAEDELVAGREVVGVVLHEARAAGEPGAHDVGDAHEDRGLPVALGAEAVALGHEALHREARQLLQRAEVLERRGEGAEAALLEERAQAELDRGAVAQRLVAVAALAQLGHDLVELLVLGDERVDVGVGCRGHRLGELVDAPRVDLHAEAQLGLGLVALGDGDVAHVVAEAGELQAAGCREAGRGALPRAELGLHARVGRVADDRLAGTPRRVWM